MLLDYSKEIDVKKGELYHQKLVEKKAKVELKEKKIRSISLNAYLHVCISIYAIEFGYTLKEAKTLLKRLCPFMVYEKNGIKFLKETHLFNNQECSEFVSWIRSHAANEGLYILTSEEYITNCFEIDKEINRHKEYL